MVIVWLEGAQGEISGACPPPPPRANHQGLVPTAPPTTPNCPAWPPPQPTLPTAPPPPPPPLPEPLAPPLQSLPQGPSAHFYWGGGRVQKRGDGPP